MSSDFLYRHLHNPILRREFNSAARNPKTAVFAALAVGVLGFILYALWPRSGIFSEANSNELFTIFLGAELTFMILLTASFTASTITSPVRGDQELAAEMEVRSMTGAGAGEAIAH